MKVTKEHSLGFVATAFPRSASRYSQVYPGAHLPLAHVAVLENRIEIISLRYWFGENARREAARLLRRDNTTVDTARGKRRLALPL